jgi:hypothetical protein
MAEGGLLELDAIRCTRSSDCKDDHRVSRKNLQIIRSSYQSIPGSIRSQVLVSWLSSEFYQVVYKSNNAHGRLLSHLGTARFRSTRFSKGLDLPEYVLHEQQQTAEFASRQDPVMLPQLANKGDSCIRNEMIAHASGV